MRYESLGNLVSITSGGTPSKNCPDYWCGNTPWISAKEMTSDIVFESTLHISSEAVKFSNIAPANSILLLTRGSGLFNEISLNWVTSEVAFNQDIKCLNCEDKLLLKYLYYYLKSTKDLQSILDVTGIGAGKFDTQRIKDIQIPMYDKSTLMKIISVCDSIYNKIYLNSKINANLFKQGQIIFDKFVIKGECISKSKLTDIAHFQNGLPMQKNRPPSGDGLPVLKIKELGQGFCDKSSERCRDDIDHSVLINNGDVVFSWSGSLMAKIWCGGKCGLNQHLFKVTSDKYPLWFYYYWLQHHMPDFIDIAANKATTMGHICRNHLEEAIVTHPKQDVMNRIDSILTPLLKKQIVLMEESSQLISIRDYLLPKLMSGEIDISQLDLVD